MVLHSNIIKHITRNLGDYEVQSHQAWAMQGVVYLNGSSTRESSGTVSSDERDLVRDEEGLITALASPSDPAMERDCCPSFSEEKSEIDGSASCCMLPFSCGTGTWIPLTPSSPKSPLSCDELSLTSFWIRGEKVWSVQVVLALHWKQKG